MKRNPRILIVRPDRIGDVVLSTALPREIKKVYPEAFIAVMLRSYTAGVYINNPHIDDIILIDENHDGSLKSFFREVKKIRRFKFTHSLTLLPTERLNYLLFFAGIPFRVGVGHKFYQFITFTRYVSRNKYIPLRHEADYCMDLVRRIGIETENIEPEIHLSPAEKETAKKGKEKLLAGKRFLVGVHITSGNSAPNWTVPTYVSLIKKLIEVPELSVVLTDNKIPEELKSIKGIAFPNEGLPLRNSIVNFAALDLLISASTGPMHICAALKVKTVSLFCPLTACSPELWGPVGNKNSILLPSENYCSMECPGNPKLCTFEGFNGITVERVLNEALKILKIL